MPFPASGNGLSGKQRRHRPGIGLETVGRNQKTTLEFATLNRRVEDRLDIPVASPTNHAGHPWQQLVIKRTVHKKGGEEEKGGGNFTREVIYPCHINDLCIFP